MKIHLSVFVITLSVLLFSVSATAQDDREDVMYLKSGTIYRGTIIEQIPNVSYKIEIAGGSVIVVAAADVVKITKEPKAAPQEEYYYKYKVVRTPKPVYEYHFRPRAISFRRRWRWRPWSLAFVS